MRDDTDHYELIHTNEHQGEKEVEEDESDFHLQLTKDVTVETTPLSQEENEIELSDNFDLDEDLDENTDEEDTDEEDTDEVIVGGEDTDEEDTDEVIVGGEDIDKEGTKEDEVLSKHDINLEQIADEEKISMLTDLMEENENKDIEQIQSKLNEFLDDSDSDFNSEIDEDSTNKTDENVDNNVNIMDEIDELLSENEDNKDNKSP